VFCAIEFLDFWIINLVERNMRIIHINNKNLTCSQTKCQLILYFLVILIYQLSITRINMTISKIKLENLFPCCFSQFLYKLINISITLFWWNYHRYSVFLIWLLNGAIHLFQLRMFLKNKLTFCGLSIFRHLSFSCKIYLFFHFFFG